MKKYGIILLMLLCIFGLFGCNSKSMNYIIENETGEYVISLDVKNKDSMTDFSIGDKVAVYYDGYIAESYPMQINTVYAITLETPADRSENEVP